MKETISARKDKCNICESNNWLNLPDPVKSHSVTTSGKIVAQPLGKSLCSKCGFVQRNRFLFMGHSEYYQEDYASYYERPGTEEYHRKRYQGLVEWMSKYLAGTHEFKTVLDVGCGQGWMMDAMLSRYPGIEIGGIEPSRHNATIAIRKGYPIVETKIEQSTVSDTYDLVYSNNVLQHINDAREFLSNMKMRLNEHGVIIVTCPDCSRPSIDLLWSDHNYSFLPEHLLNIGYELGFKTAYVAQSNYNPSIPPAQLLLLTNNPGYSGTELAKGQTPVRDINHDYSKKVEYLLSFIKLNDYLAQKISGFSTVYNFGASYWTSVIAAYCPDYWNRVEACVIDTQDNVTEFMGKRIVELTKLKNKDQVAIVLGTAPTSHDWLANRLQDYASIIRWDKFFEY